MDLFQRLRWSRDRPVLLLSNVHQVSARGGKRTGASHPRSVLAGQIGTVGSRSEGGCTSSNGTTTLERSAGPVLPPVSRPIALDAARQRGKNFKIS